MSDSILIDVFQIAVLIYSVVLHELAHGFIARSLGDTTAEDMGRLTLNPIKHMDLFGSVILPLVSRFTTGFMFGYAKPVPYNPEHLRDRVYGPAKVALAGPVTNILLAVAAALVIRFGSHLLSLGAIQLIGYVVWINLILAVFNLVPIPPLDGHWLVMTLLPDSARDLKIMLYRFQWFFLIIFIFFVFPYLIPLLTRLYTLLTGMTIF